jgi:hypothetical protein
MATGIKILSVIYKFSYQASVFVPGAPFQPSIIFDGKAGAYPSEATFKCSSLWQALGLKRKH